VGEGKRGVGLIFQGIFGGYCKVKGPAAAGGRRAERSLLRVYSTGVCACLRGSPTDGYRRW
jgi:hypothetical protein